jgi:hypothetical protein
MRSPGLRLGRHDILLGSLRGKMNKILYNLRGLLGIALTWSILWAAAMMVAGTIIRVVDPDSIDPGEEPIVLGAMVGLVGFMCGAVFSGILFIAERSKTLVDLSLSRAAMWGIVVSAAFLLLMSKDIRMIFLLGPLGAVSALASVAVARRRLNTRKI